MQGPDSGKGKSRQHRRFTQPQEEEGGETQEDAAVVDLETIIRTNIMQKMQAVVVKEETRDHGGALEAEGDIKIEITAIQMVAGFVEKQGTMQTSAIITSQVTEEVTGHNKKIMHQHQMLQMMDVYL